MITGGRVSTLLIASSGNSFSSLDDAHFQ